MRIHAIGDFSAPEFQPIAAELHRDAEIACDRTAAAAIERILHTSQWPELFVLAQRRPGEFRELELDHLQELAPLARCIGLLGPWCEGEARSGTPWPGMIRTYWHQWQSRYRSTMAELSAGAWNAWSVSSSAEPEQRLLHASPVARQLPEQLIAIASRNYEVADALGEVCNHAGYGSAWLGPDGATLIRGASLALWDGRTDEIDAFNALQQRLPKLPWVALLDFPRPEAALAFSRAGATAVVSKPFLVADLAHCIEQAIGAQPRLPLRLTA